MFVWFLLSLNIIYAQDTIYCLPPEIRPRAVEEFVEQNRIVRNSIQPTAETCNSITYSLPNTILAPGQELYLEIPPRHQSAAVQSIVLGHRQDPNSRQNRSVARGAYDPRPGLTSVQILSSNFAPEHQWRYWAGDATGNLGAKYAEIRAYPEIENLYEWGHYGHRSINGGELSTEPIHPQLARIQSLGEDSVIVSEVTIKLRPPTASHYDEVAFSTGTVIGDPQTEHGRTYGGGQAYRGRFPGAIALGYTQNSGSTRHGWSQQDRRLLHPIQAGKKIVSISVSCGDSHPDEGRNPDGGWGERGWGRLSVGLKRADGEIIWFVERENVPPEGVIHASPPTCDLRAQPGDQIIVEASGDTVYVMAIRIGSDD